MFSISDYRRLAAEARQIATSVSAQDIKDALEKVALDYDKLAGDLERKHGFPWWGSKGQDSN